LRLAADDVLFQFARHYNVDCVRTSHGWEYLLDGKGDSKTSTLYVAMKHGGSTNSNDISGIASTSQIFAKRERTFTKLKVNTEQSGPWATSELDSTITHRYACDAISPQMAKNLLVIAVHKRRLTRHLDSCRFIALSHVCGGIKVPQKAFLRHDLSCPLRTYDLGTRLQKTPALQDECICACLE